MIPLKTVTAICLGVTLCSALTINISGTVRDRAGAGISGATVKLENAGLSATTGNDGSFTLAGATGIKIKTGTGSVSSPMVIQNGMIKIALLENALVSVTIYDICGRQVLSSRKLHNAGMHTIKLSLQSNGMYLCKVTIGNYAYSFKTTSFGFSSIGNKAMSDNAVVTGEASVSAKISDIIAVVADGQIDYSDSMRTSDTSGVVIKMIPNAGNVLDIDGNMYQSVKIGNQVWTLQNLRVTKYNDGSPIVNSISNSAWDSCNANKTGAYCYYDNTAAINSIKKYGALYNGYALKAGKLAPEGWHVPTSADWDTLRHYLLVNGYNYDGTTTSDKFAKSMAAKTDWAEGKKDGAVGNDLSTNNKSGFSGLPGGCRSTDGSYHSKDFEGLWWATPESSSVNVRVLSSIFESLSWNDVTNDLGVSVRLLRD